MTKRSITQVKGRLGELQFAIELERQGISCVDMTSQDYGLDVVAMLPKYPLTDLAIRASDRGAKSVDPWEMSATLISLQVKNVMEPTLTTEHLMMWNAANFRRPGSCFVVFVSDDNFQILDPDDIEQLFLEASASNQASIGPFVAGRTFGTTFPRPNEDGHLGRFLSGWGNLGGLLMDVSEFRTALVEGRLLDEDEATGLLTNLLLLNHLEDNDLQDAVTHGGGQAILNEIQDLIELIQPVCSHPNLFDGDDAINDLANQILSDNTWNEPEGREKAFNRYNRSLPRFLPATMNEFIRSYAAYAPLR